MNNALILDSLHRDMVSIYGDLPQLTMTRTALYEQLWRDLLPLLEYTPNGVYQMHDTCHATSATSSYLLVVTFDDRTPDALLCPSELLGYVKRFIGGETLLLRALRQICLFTYKSKSNEVTASQRDDAIAGFRERNAICSLMSFWHYSEKSRMPDDTGRTLRIAKLLCCLATQDCDFRDIRPGHGPGAVADSKQGWFKWRAIDGKTTRLCDKFYPISEFFCPTLDAFDYASASFVNGHSKLAIVPKDKRGPRIICTQPSGLMWIQQGQRRNLEKAISSSAILKTNRGLITPGVSASIQFDSQAQNGMLALESSRTRELATIDLKDASDLISWGLVRFLFNKETVRWLAASRSMHVKLHDGTIEKIHMYAPMGSAMCFPVESLVFWAIATAATLVQRGVTYEHIVGQSPDRKGGGAAGWLRTNLSEVFVFGDDIIVRREACEYVCDRFRGCGLRPNLQKTFYRGFYRESCGVDAYRGVRLDIARLQCPTLTSMSEAYATLDLVNRSRAMGLVNLSSTLESELEAFLGFRLAVGNYGGLLDRGFPCDWAGAVMASVENHTRGATIRYNTELQRHEAWSIIARPRRDFTAPQDGRYRLFRGLTTGVDEHTTDWLSPDDLQYHLGWVAAY